MSDKPVTVDGIEYVPLRVGSFMVNPSGLSAADCRLEQGEHFVGASLRRRSAEPFSPSR